MQFIENSVMALRAAHYRLVSSSKVTQFLLFPMIHIGSADYYAAVRSRLEGCDTILFEGVSSNRVRILTLSYSIVARRKRLGLVTQREALQLPSVKLIHGDVTANEFAESWLQVPWYWRIAIGVLAPLVGVYRYLTASRASLARGLKSEDLESRDDMLRGEHLPEVEEAIVDRRDIRLVEVLERVVNGEGNAQSVAIIYGAGHMRAVTRALMGRHQYRVAHSEWLTVFSHVDV